MNNQNENNEAIIIEDLNAQDADEIKGGQTREHILLARQVGVPAVQPTIGTATTETGFKPARN